jgi:FAD/FMN-containing dehydrogenase
MPLIDQLKTIVGAGHWTTDAAELEPHLHEWRGTVSGRTLVMLSPDSPRQVAEIVKACAAAKVGIVPQGGNTGLCGGAIPDDSGEQVLLSLSRLNRIRSIDAADFSMTLEAGCVLQTAQEAAARHQRLLPLSLAAEGSCQIGGNISTNAGGINVLRYGTMRQQVLGLEVVLADGTLWDGLRALRKDTGGYDMKQVFIGSEGTLGIITAATLRLFPAISARTTALLAVPAAMDAVRLLGDFQSQPASEVLACELMSNRAYRYGFNHVQATRAPLGTEYPWYVLLESATDDADEQLQSAIAGAMESGQVLDAVIAKNVAEADKIWQIRHSISAGQKLVGVSLKHDISVPVGRIGEFLDAAEREILALVPQARIVAFGHVGDGNLHYNITQPADADGESFRESGLAASRAVYDLVAALGGSFSAEHGVGVVKKQYLRAYRSTIEVDMMRTLKDAMDPQNILNPGKVI